MDISEKPPQHYEQTVSFDSPWLQFERPSWPKLHANAACDVAIVGGGISGIVTLYYLLTETDKKVMLVEQARVASQATGNNAALACIHIERPIQELVEEYGLEKTRQSFLEVDESWDIMLSILAAIDAKELLELLPNISLAMTSVDVLRGHIEREKYNRTFGRAKWHYYVADDVDIAEDEVEIHRISKQELLQKLEIVDKDYIAVAVPQEDVKLGRLNSAQFSHRLLEFLSKNYKERFCIYEETPISAIRQAGNTIALTHPTGTISAYDVVLCTNGYKNFEIRTESGATVERLHNALIPREGYMAAFSDAREAYAQAFFDDQGKYTDSPYFYISHINNFSVLGGPEFEQPDGKHAPQAIQQRAKASLEIYRQFLKNTYNKEMRPFSYFWYGIMGYTSNGLRWVGEEPELSHLWYNLGCNGIGITTSIGAAKRLVALMQGKSLPASLFDIGP